MTGMRSVDFAHAAGGVREVKVALGIAASVQLGCRHHRDAELERQGTQLLGHVLVLHEQVRHVHPLAWAEQIQIITYDRIQGDATAGNQVTKIGSDIRCRRAAFGHLHVEQIAISGFDFGGNFQFCFFDISPDFFGTHSCDHGRPSQVDNSLWHLKGDIGDILTHGLPVQGEIDQAIGFATAGLAAKNGQPGFLQAAIQHLIDRVPASRDDALIDGLAQQQGEVGTAGEAGGAIDRDGVDLFGPFLHPLELALVHQFDAVHHHRGRLLQPAELLDFLQDHRGDLGGDGAGDGLHLDAGMRPDLLGKRNHIPVQTVQYVASRVM